jgi:Predicted integral membrane protein
MPTSSFLPLLLLVAAIGCALIGGIFFAFSVFVMRALARLPAAHGIAAMQSINIAVITPLFLVPFFGTGAVCLAAAIVARNLPTFPAIVGATLLYLVGTLLTTMAANVPLNNRLARLDSGDAASPVVWKRYITRWTLWNHLRTASALLAAALLLHSLR